MERMTPEIPRERTPAEQDTSIASLTSDSDNGSMARVGVLCGESGVLNESAPPLPLHPPSVPSSPRSGHVASSEEESVAELDDVASEGEGSCSSVDDFHTPITRRQDELISNVDDIGSTQLPRSGLRPASSPDVDLGMRIPVAASSREASGRGESVLDCGPNRPTLPQTPTFAPPSPRCLAAPALLGKPDPADHRPASLPTFHDTGTCMWTASHAANSPSEDRSSSLVNVLLQPLPPNSDLETHPSLLEHDYSSLIRLNLWSVIDGHGGGCVATYASEVLLPHIAATIARALSCFIVDRGVCTVNGQLRDANALDLDGLIKTSDRSPANPNSIQYRSPYEADESEGEGEGDGNRPSKEGGNRSPKTAQNQKRVTPVVDSEGSVASSLMSRSEPGASVSSVKTSVKTAVSPAVRDAPIGTHSPSEVAAITHAITESFLAVDEGWINSIDPVSTQQTSCQSNGRWNAGACALVVFTVQRLEWTNVSEAEGGNELKRPEKRRGHDTSQNRDAARRRMLDYAARAKSASSVSTISSCSSLTTEDVVTASGLESEITETEGEDDRSTDAKARKWSSARCMTGEAIRPKESLISAPCGCSCHFYRAHSAMLYTAHVGDCRAVMLGSAPPRTIKVCGSAYHPDTTDDESSHHSSDETECLSSSDHDAESSDDEDDTEPETNAANAASATNSAYMTYMRRPARRQRRRANDGAGTHAPFIALPPLDRCEGFRSIEIEVENEADRRERRNLSGREPSDSSTSSGSSVGDLPAAIQLPPVTRPIDLTTDHSAYNPAEVTAVLRRCNNAPRAISAGGGGGIKRVAGSLAVTRALGDAYLKTPKLSFFPYKRHAPYITARPEVNCRPVLKDGDKVLILATDGVWERASGEDVLRWVRNYYAERIAEAERRNSRRSLNHADKVSVDGSVGNRSPQDSLDQENDDNCDGGLRKKREVRRSPSPPAKRRKLTSRCGRRGTGSVIGSSVADVIVRRVLNKVRRARNISTLQALMSLPPGRARRSKHDDITASVVDLSAFVA